MSSFDPLNGHWGPFGDGVDGMLRFQDDLDFNDYLQKEGHNPLASRPQRRWDPQDPNRPWTGKLTWEDVKIFWRELIPLFLVFLLAIAGFVILIVRLVTGG